MQGKPARAEVVFSSDTNAHSPATADALGVTYARSHRWLHALKSSLIHQHRWAEAPSSDPRMLFSLETSSIWRSSVGLPARPALRLQLPVHATSFFFPERRVHLRKICPPINDILNLVQCLLTGIVTVVVEENLSQGIYRTTRGLPPVSWINANEQMLVEIFGVPHYRHGADLRVMALRKACSDTATAFKLEVVPYRR
ncbi:hypothetical protein DFH06DRAFT_1269242 [Mycena polygramma]|nr:hypothetical protein DFH06DRAFT_1269242 [Mycena polygramma]